MDVDNEIIPVLRKKLKQNELKLEEHIKKLDKELLELKEEKTILISKIETLKGLASNRERELLSIEEKLGSLKNENEKLSNVIMKTAGDVQGLSWKLIWCQTLAENQLEELRKKSQEVEKHRQHMLECFERIRKPHSHSTDLAAEPMPISSKEDINEIAKLEEIVKRLQNEKQMLQVNLESLQKPEDIQQDIEKLEKRNQKILMRLHRQLAESQKRKQHLEVYLSGLKRESNL